MAVYLDVAEALESEIRNHFESGQFLPSEMELAERFAINRHTLRRAVDELVSAGLLLRQHGKGTMVVDNKIEYSLRSKGRFTESLEEMGLEASCEVRSIREISADIKLAKRMWVKPGTALTHIETVRCIDQTPVCLISHYLVSSLLPGIAGKYKVGSLHQLIEAEYQKKIRRDQSLIGASLPTREEALQLQCSRSLPLIIVRSNNRLKESNEVIEYSVSRSRSDVFEMKINPEE
ncbi:phosphonate metabolism transcriptional regulator PhnF [Alkalimarinus coralli]|uniref:phosphonate metabolism transcriptional regulator PhnF n=1 Tax=Alkalimarinus coralli TaxID=2935863 RepID=UPI00202ACAB4|nr:phosphonate metabolism transcriptional regulator PhnF [Alkalimarinus coralli]